MLAFSLLLSVLTAIVPAIAESTFSPLRPPAIPLAVRSPYLNVWLNGESGGYLPGNWPNFWTGQITGWQGLIRVDNVTYNWMGAYPGPELVNQTSFRYTSTQSIFTFDVAGKVTLTATFLSPVHAVDTLRQSIPFSYLHVTVESTDNDNGSDGHDVQVYCDMSGELAAANKSTAINWTMTETQSHVMHEYSRVLQEELHEEDDMASWGTFVFGTDRSVDMTYSQGQSDIVTRNRFIEHGSLGGVQDGNFRAIEDNWPVFAYAVDLGTVTKATSTRFSLGIVQDYAVAYYDQEPGLLSYWKTQHATADDVFAFFHDNWARELADAQTLDAQVEADSVAAAGAKYAALTSLVVRQVFGSLAYAARPNESDSDDTGLPYIFIKETSSDGDTQTADVLFPAMPIFLYLNPHMVPHMLAPLVAFQRSGAYPNPWAMHDMGVFPSARGYPGGDDEPMPLEESANMLLMALASKRFAGSGNGTSTTSLDLDLGPLMDQWAQYLVNASLVPEEQLSTDDFAGKLANQTNLALKGILGIAAASVLAQEDAGGMNGTNANANANANATSASSSHYRTTAEAYIKTWQRLATNTAADPPHAMLAYGQADSYGVLYNLYMDRLLGLDLVPSDVYAMQSTFYASVLQQQSSYRFGLPLDSRHNWCKSDWALFAAAVAAPDVRDRIVEGVYRMAAGTTSNRPLTDLYDAATGNFFGINFMNRPVTGAFFALLAVAKAV